MDFMAMDDNGNDNNIDDNNNNEEDKYKICRKFIYIFSSQILSWILNGGLPYAG